jgi:hypothetical protein
MDTDHKNDTPEPYPVSAGSQPEAIMSWEQADLIIQDQRAEIERLRVNLRLADAGFTFGAPTLTDEEREAIAWAINKTAQAYDDPEGGPIKREAMRGLLQRTK